MDTSIEILYEDNHLFIVNKKPSQIVQGDKTGDIPLGDLIKDFIKKRDQKPGNVYLGLVHRLDRPVSGVVVFAKTSKALSRMNELFKNRETKKVYWSVVPNNTVPDAQNLVNYLRKNEAQNKSYVTAENAKGALRCELSYKTLKKGDRYRLIEVHPITGRHHQIRVQLSNAGLTIVGDVKYGDKRANEDKSICLHARSLTFVHPVQKEEITVTAPPPNTKYWNIFK